MAAVTVRARAVLSDFIRVLGITRAGVWRTRIQTHTGSTYQRYVGSGRLRSTDKELTMTWKAFHNRGETLRSVIAASARRRDGILPMDVDGVSEFFRDELDLLAAL